MKIFAGAGEPSGDRILADLLHGLRARFPDLELRGFGGPLSAARGLTSPVRFDHLAVNGVGDVLRSFPRLAFHYLHLRRELRRFRPDLVLLVDYPGMNVGLAALARRLGIPVHYVAPPQLWAYRAPARRLRRLRRTLRGVSLQTLFPFEQETYAPWSAGLASGHFFPVPPTTAREGARLLLCPGSRRAVLRRNLPLWLNRLRGISQPVDLLVPPFLREEAHRHCREFSLEVVTDPETAYARAGRAIAFPGTVTLELFLRRIPVAVWAVMDPLTLWAGRRALRRPWLSLPNLLLEKTALPEWMGTSREFMRNPPKLGAFPEILAADVASVLEKTGRAEGVEVGVQACLKLLEKP